MPRVSFTSNLRRHVSCPAVTVDGSTVAESLEAVFRDNPRLGGYVVDEQGRVRNHVVVFVDGRTIDDRVRLSDAVSPESEIYVMQALSGG